MIKNFCVSFLLFVPALLSSKTWRETIDMEHPKPTNPDDAFGQFRIPEGEDPFAHSKKLLDEKVREGQAIDSFHLDLEDEDSDKKIHVIAPKENDVIGYSSDFENEPVLEKIREAGNRLLKAVRAKSNVKSNVQEFKKVLEEIVYFARQNKSEDINKRFVDGNFGMRQILQNLDNPRPREAFMVRELRAIVTQEATALDIEIAKERRWVLERYATLLEYLEKALNEITLSSKRS